jgi:uncharacterized membrane protein
MIGLLIEWIHILSVLWLVAGVAGRGACTGLAGRTDDFNTVRTLMQAAHTFEMKMVRPSSFFILATGLITARMGGWPILGFLQGASVNWVLAALVIYLTIIPVILFVFLPRGRIYRKALQEAGARGTVTPELRAALHDPAVRWARLYEILMLLVITFLMVVKPF